MIHSSKVMRKPGCYHWSTQPTTNSHLSRFKPHSQHEFPKLPPTPLSATSVMSCPTSLPLNFPPPSPNNSISPNLKNQLFAPSATISTSLFPADKGNTTAILNKDDYLVEAICQLSDPSTVQPHSILEPRPPPSHLHCWSLPRLIRNRHLLSPQHPTPHPLPVHSA